MSLLFICIVPSGPLQLELVDGGQVDGLQATRCFFILDMKKELSDIEKFCVHAILFCSDSQYLDLAYRLTRKKESSAEDPAILHKMALRWLREDEMINDYIRDLGYEPFVDDSGLKRFRINIDDEGYKVK